MKKLILILLITTVSCGLSESEKATIKEQIANLNIEISELKSSPDIANYNYSLSDIESAKQRKEDLSASLKKETDDQNILELKSQLEGADDRIKISEDRSNALKQDFYKIQKLTTAKKEKLIALENKLK